MTNQTNKSATPKPAEFMSDKTRAFVEPVRKMLAEGINVQATGEATNRIIEGAFRSLVEHIDELEMDLAALRTAVALSSTAPAAEEFRRGADEAPETPAKRKSPDDPYIQCHGCGRWLYSSEAQWADDGEPFCTRHRLNGALLTSGEG